MEEFIEVIYLNKKYTFPLNFFSEPNFIERFKQQLKLFRKKIQEEDNKEEIKGPLNAFFLASVTAIKDENINLLIQIKFYETLNFYGQHYSCEETFKNIIKAFEDVNFKEKAFTKYPIKGRMIYAETLLWYHNVIKFKKPLFSREKTELLLKAKFYLWKIYIRHIENINIADDVDLSHTLTLLSVCLTELSRWFEPLYYLNTAELKVSNNPNINYSRVLILDAIAQKAYLDFNGLLFLKILNCCSKTIKLPHIYSLQKPQMLEFEKKYQKVLSEYGVAIKKLRQHERKAKQFSLKHKLYKKFCFENQLFLNEHSFFCLCERATRDDIKIQTHFPHTNTEWTAQFNLIIEIITSDFILARFNYYQSLNNSKISNDLEDTIKNKTDIPKFKNSLLKNSFKALYSILDQIGYGILKVLNIGYETKLKLKYENGKIPKLYFLNMWDLELFEEKNFENYYLTSLYSISRDINKE